MNAADERTLDAVVVGGGFAGLGVSHALKAAGLDHLVFEWSRICETWRTQRWASFRMNTPNVQTAMPDDLYGGGAPEGFLTRDAFVAMIEGFGARHALPVETGTPVASIEADGEGGFRVLTPQGTVRARSVVATTGNLNVPKRPAFAAGVPASVAQIDGSDYRAAGELRRERSWSSVAATPAARSPRTWRWPGVRCSSRPAATGRCRDAIAAATSCCG